MEGRGRGRKNGSGGAGNYRAAAVVKKNGETSAEPPIAGLNNLNIRPLSSNTNTNARRRTPEDEGTRASRVRREFEYVPTKDVAKTKVGLPSPGTGLPVQLVANYFILKKKTDWCVYSYWVDFSLGQENTTVQKALLRNHQKSLGTYVFDGHCLWTIQKLSPMPMVLNSTIDGTDKIVQLNIKLVKELGVGDPSRLQFFNIIVRSSFNSLKLLQIQRNFFDMARKIELPEQGLTLLPGYMTTLRQYENNLMLNVGIIHKILRTDTALNVIETVARNGQYNQASQDRIKNKLVGCTVRTWYNDKFYKISDVDFTKSPLSTFPKKDNSNPTFSAYYKDNHKLTITNTAQPLLVSRPSKKDFHRGDSENILLIPELCSMTGITDENRSNQTYMRAIIEKTQQDPKQKLTSTKALVLAMQGNPEIRANLQTWGLEFDSTPVSVMGRQLPEEDIYMGTPQNGSQKVKYSNSAWQNNLKCTRMHENKELRSWIIIVGTSSRQEDINNFIAELRTVGHTMGFQVPNPLSKIQVAERPDAFITGIQKAVQSLQRTDLVVIILPNNKAELYQAVKKTCCYEIGVPSQCVLARNTRKGFDDSKFKSVCTKIVVQINAKLGGEPWVVSNPFKTQQTMVVGFDVYHCGKRTGQSVGAMVASTNRNLSKYYSTVTYLNRGQEVSESMCSEFTKCLDAFTKINGELPTRIFFYRDGVGEGQLPYVVDSEVKGIQLTLNDLYLDRKDKPKLTFIVVTKRINTRLFQPTGNAGGMVNPKSGTVVDNVITLPERYDFYLISQNAGAKGTVSPTSYNVILDEQDLPASRLQLFSYKLTHNYYNWSGPVSVPSVCQYAHKLAYLTGKSMGQGDCKSGLSHTLYYL